MGAEISKIAFEYLQQVVQGAMDFIYPNLAGFYCTKIVRVNGPVLKTSQISRLFEIGFSGKSWENHKKSLKGFIKHQAKRDACGQGLSWSKIEEVLIELLTAPFDYGDFQNQFVEHICESAKTSSGLGDTTPELEYFSWRLLSKTQQCTLKLHLSRRYLRILYDMHRAQDTMQTRDVVCQKIRKGVMA